MAVDPVRFTNFHLNEIELEEYILFCIAVAGKQAIKTSQMLDVLIDSSRPFASIRDFGSCSNLRERMKEIGFGCHDLKSRGMWWISYSGLNLKTCTVADLEECPGIGMKTSRFFAMFTRENERSVAALDTHILKYMRDQGYENIPKQTPSSKKQYFKIQKQFLEICNKVGWHPAKFDLMIWNNYRTKRLMKV